MTSTSTPHVGFTSRLTNKFLSARQRPILCVPVSLSGCYAWGPSAHRVDLENTPRSESAALGQHHPPRPQAVQPFAQRQLRPQDLRLWARSQCHHRGTRIRLTDGFHDRIRCDEVVPCSRNHAHVRRCQSCLCKTEKNYCCSRLFPPCSTQFPTIHEGCRHLYVIRTAFKSALPLLIGRPLLRQGLWAAFAPKCSTADRCFPGATVSLLARHLSDIIVKS